MLVTKDREDGQKIDWDWNADSVPKLFETEKDVAERRVVREEFNLAWTVEEDVVI